MKYNFRETELRKYGSKGRQGGRSQRLAVIIYPYSENREGTGTGPGYTTSRLPQWPISSKKVS